FPKRKHFHSILIIANKTSKVSSHSSRRKIRKKFNVVLQLLITIELWFEHLIGSNGISLSTMCIFQTFATVKLIGSRQGALFHFMENGLYIHTHPPTHVKVNIRAKHFLSKDRDIKTI